MNTINGSTLLDYIIVKHNLKNDAALARFLELPQPVISKVRHDKLPFGATNIIRLHELTGWTIADIKAMLPPPAAKL